MNRKNQQNRYTNEVGTRDLFEDFFGMRDKMLSNFGFGMSDPFDDDFFGKRVQNRFNDFGSNFD